jgi:surfeit locus 1 family protein
VIQGGSQTANNEHEGEGDDDAHVGERVSARPDHPASIFYYRTVSRVPLFVTGGMAKTSRVSRFAHWFAPVPTIATVIVVAIACSLGNWQLNRGQEKRALAAQLQSLADKEPTVVVRTRVPVERVLYHRVKVRGEFEASRTILLENRPHGDAQASRAGFHVLTPLRIEGEGGDAAYVLVNRGWLPRDAQDRTRIQPFDTLEGMHEIEGTVLAGPTRVYALGEQNEAGRQIRQNAEVGALAAEWGVSLQPFLIQQEGGKPDGLVRDWPQPDSGAAKHDGYAFQWFALAALTVVFWGASGYRRSRGKAH